MSLGDALLSLEGLAAGDAFGNSLSHPQTAALIAGRVLPRAPWRWSDDTQMAFSVVEELRQRGWIDQDSLARRFASRYLSDPGRGYGAKTRQTLERIAHGEYFRIAAQAAFEGGSFGSGAAARSAPAGGYFAGSPDRAAREARLAAGVTHLHPEGAAGAEAAAAAAALAGGEPQLAGADFLCRAAEYVSEGVVRQRILLAAGIPAQDAAQAVERLGAGGDHSAQDTVPFALWCAAHHLDDFEAALWWAASGPGGRDTTCAIVGAIVALRARRIPRAWVRRREPLPHGLAWIRSGHVGRPGRGDLPAAGEARLEEPVRTFQGSSLPAIRVDPLTGIPNLLGLFDWLDRQQALDCWAPFSLLAIQLPALWKTNRAQGRTAGDELLIRCAEALQAGLPGCIFRAGGDKFAARLQKGHPAQNTLAARGLLLDLAKTERSAPPPRTAVVHFSRKEEATSGLVLASLYLALADRRHAAEGGGLQELSAADIRAMADFPWIMVDLADQMIRLGLTADQSLRLAQTDSISQLPNMRAALGALETGLISARDRDRPLAVLMMDGDNLRRFNEAGYEVGNEAIRLLGVTLQGLLRETDFLARWLTGDEFLALLPDTAEADAVQTGQRMLAAVEAASRAWLFPTTISIGIAVYPRHGQTVQDLLRAAELGLKSAKHCGKNQVVVAGA